MRHFSMENRFILSLGLITVVTALISITTTFAEDTPNLAAIDAFINAEMQAARIPGISLAIIEDQQIVYLRGYGVADPTGRPVTPQTPFLLGSLSKSFTALAIMQLVEAGKLELDAPVQRYLSWFHVADAESSARISVRHLLNQTSGLPESVGIKGLVDGDLSDGALERHVRALGQESLTQPVGSAFQYCNSNYTILGLLVQVVSGQSYEQYVQQHIFVPLDMRSSYTSQALARPNGMATGYRQWFGIPFAADLPYIRGELPAGYLVSSVEDMAHYMIAHLNQGRYQHTTVISPEGMIELHKPGNAPRVGLSPTEESDHYAMGWFVGSRNGIPVFYHDGTTPNFQAAIIIQPERRLGIVLLMNTRTPNKLASGVLDILVNGHPPAIERYPLRDANYLIIFMIQVIAVLGSAWTLWRWHTRPRHHPYHRWGVAWRIGLPLVLDIVIVLLALWELLGPPTIRLRLLFDPAITWLAIVCGSWAILWGTFRTILSICVLKRTGAHPFTRSQV